MEWFLNLLHLQGSLRLFAVWGKFLGKISIFKMRPLLEEYGKIKWKSVHFEVLKMTKIGHFSDFDSFEKLNLMSKLATMKLLISLVWNWNLLLSLLWLKDRCCITTQKSCSQTHSLGTFSMYFGIKLLFLRNPSDNSLVVEAMVGFFWFISVQINHKNSFSYPYGL